MIRKILVHEDALADSHPALARAVQLTRFGATEVKVVDVVDGPTRMLRDLHHPLRTIVEQERADRLRAICEPIDSAASISSELLRGRPFVEIVREVVHAGFHLVVKAAEHRPPYLGGIAGPVDMRLVRNCPCPVWLEAEPGDAPLQRILVAIDPQADDDEPNVSLLEISSSLARHAGAELHVISAWEVPDEDFLVGHMKPEKVSRYSADVQSLARGSLDRLIGDSRLAVAPAEVWFRKGGPAREILACAEQSAPDLLVIGTVSRTTVRGLLIGNTADYVLRSIRCPVLAAKPPNLLRV